MAHGDACSLGWRRVVAAFGLVLGVVAVDGCGESSSNESSTDADSDSGRCTIYNDPVYGPCGWPSACGGYGGCEPHIDTGITTEDVSHETLDGSDSASDSREAEILDADAEAADVAAGD